MERTLLHQQSFRWVQELRPGRVLEEVFSNADLTQEDMDIQWQQVTVVFLVENADKQLSEITCHAKGIFHLVPSARTIIDIGGQDAKSHSAGQRGHILKFVMNDKCAAGVQAVSWMLCVKSSGSSIRSDGKKSICMRRNGHRSAVTCTVFAESEVTSQL